MRKVSATVIYKDNTLYNLTVNHKGVLFRWLHTMKQA